MLNAAVLTLITFVSDIPSYKNYMCINVIYVVHSLYECFLCFKCFCMSSANGGSPGRPNWNFCPGAPDCYHSQLIEPPTLSRVEYFHQCMFRSLWCLFQLLILCSDMQSRPTMTDKYRLDLLADHKGNS